MNIGEHPGYGIIHFVKKVTCHYPGCKDPDITETIIDSNHFVTGKGSWFLASAGPFHLHGARISGIEETQPEKSITRFLKKIRGRKTFPLPDFKKVDGQVVLGDASFYEFGEEDA